MIHRISTGRLAAFFRALSFVLAGLAATAAHAESVLIVAADSTHTAAADGLQPILTAAGNTVTRASSLPSDISGYQQIWDLRANLALSTGDQSAYVAFLQSGRRAFIMGENTSYGAARNATLITLLGTLGAGTYTISGGTNTQTINWPWNSQASSISYPAAGMFMNRGRGSFITNDPANSGIGSALAFSPGTLTAAPAGTLAVVLDVNFLQPSYQNQAGCLALSQSLVGYVSGTIVEAYSVSKVTGPANGTYGVGANLNFTVTMSSATAVTGTPQLTLVIGGVAHTANYVSGTGTTSLVFRYTVQANDNDADGISVSSPLVLNGGSLRDSTNTDAVLTFTPPTTTGVLVDTIAPAAPSAPVSAANPTNNVRPTLTGTAEAGSTVRVFDGATQVGSSTASGAGTWSITLSGALAEGSHSLTATATDAAGNASSSSAALNLLVDTTAPVITSATTASGTYGTSGFSYTVTATDANGVTGYSATGLPSGLSLDPATGAITGTPLQAGLFSVTLGATDAAGNSGSAVLSLTIAKASLTVSGISAADRAYDGTRTATLAGTPSLVGVLPADNSSVALAGTAMGTFADAHVGNAKVVTVSGLALSGAAADNYALVPPTTSASITARALIPSITIADKVYDATNSAAINGRSLSGVVGEDNVTLGASGVATFNSAAVGSAKTVTVTGLALSGAAASDYLLTTTTVAASASISTRPVTVTVNGGQSKVYGASDAALTYAVTSGSLAGTDVFAGALTREPGENVGTYAIGQGTLSLGGNYAVTFVGANFAITAKTLTGAVAAASKVYDGSSAATITARSLTGIVSNDDVTLTGGTASFDSRQVGAAKTVTVTGLTLTGAAAGNYALASTTVTTTASITTKALTVTGLSIAPKTYDHTTTATIVTTGTSLIGVAGSDDVSIVASGVVATFADPNAGAGKTVTITGMTLGGADAGNYTLTQPSATGTINPAPGTITLGGLGATYSGATNSALAQTVPAGLPTTITYNGGPAAPVNAGTYTVVATITDPNYTGSTSGKLVINPAPQTITFAGGTAAIGTPVSLAATASSGLPVTFELVSGNGTVSGSTLTVLSAGSVIVRAKQVGSNNYLAGSVDATFTVAGKQNQVITFVGPSDRLSNSGSVTLTATASSGLPVSLVVTSGPALLSGNTLTLTGTAGTVVVRASQPGNDAYNAAPDVTASFRVTAAVVNVYFGTVTTSGSTAKAGDIAATMPPNSNQGSLLVVAPGAGVNTVLSFTVRPDGTFSQTAGVIDSGVTVAEAGDTPKRAAAATALTVTGTLINGRLSGVIQPLGLSFSADVLPVTGPSADAAGFYTSSTLAANAGTAYSIVGSNNQVLVLAQTPTIVTGGLTTMTSNGTFSLSASTTAGQATISGRVDQPTTTVAGTIQVAGQSVGFAGLSSATLRTDRLVNLSSRVRVGGGDRVLITGFVIGGNAPKQVLIRGVGPALSGFGVGGALSNPRIRVYRGTQVVAENDDWSTASNATAMTAAAARVGAFGLSSGSADAALLTTLDPGAYSVQVFDGGDTGVALAEIYDASENPNSDYQRLVNISTRGEAGAGENVLIGGFIVTGNAPKKLLIRGIGPGLTAFGVAGALNDPRLRVFSGTTLVAENDNWSTVATDATAVTAAGTATGAFALASGSKDAALIVTLAPGAYTAQVSAVDGQTGVALVEIYEVPQN